MLSNRSPPPTIHSSSGSRKYVELEEPSEISSISSDSEFSSSTSSRTPRRIVVANNPKYLNLGAILLLASTAIALGVGLVVGRNGKNDVDSFSPKEADGLDSPYDCEDDERRVLTATESKGGQTVVAPAGRMMRTRRLVSETAAATESGMPSESEESGRSESVKGSKSRKKCVRLSKSDKCASKPGKASASLSLSIDFEEGRGGRRELGKEATMPPPTQSEERPGGSSTAEETSTAISLPAELSMAISSISPSYDYVSHETSTATSFSMELSIKSLSYDFDKGGKGGKSKEQQQPKQFKSKAPTICGAGSGSGGGGSKSGKKGHGDSIMGGNSPLVAPFANGSIKGNATLSPRAPWTPSTIGGEGSIAPALQAIAAAPSRPPVVATGALTGVPITSSSPIPGRTPNETLPVLPPAIPAAATGSPAFASSTSSPSDAPAMAGRTFLPIEGVATTEPIFFPTLEVPTYYTTYFPTIESTTDAAASDSPTRKPSDEPMTTFLPIPLPTLDPSSAPVTPMPTAPEPTTAPPTRTPPTLAPVTPSPTTPEPATPVPSLMPTSNPTYDALAANAMAAATVAPSFGATPTVSTEATKPPTEPCRESRGGE